MLTDKLTRFVEHYTGDCEGNGAKAAEAVGCSSKAAKVMACRWLRKPDVREAITARTALIANQPLTDEQKSKIADVRERREILSKMLRDIDLHPHARIKATDIINKMDGLYITKVGDPDGKPLIPPGASFVFGIKQIAGSENKT